MKYINVRRIFLNIGMLFIFVSLLALGYSLWSNRNIVTVDAVVTGEQKSDTGYREYGSSETTYPYSDYSVDYKWEGVTYSRTILRETGEYSIGDRVQIEIDKELPADYNYNTLESDIILVLMTGIPGLLLTILCRSAFKGYKKDYLLRYKKSVIFSVRSGWVPIIYYFTAYLHPAPAMMFEGLTEAVTLLFLTALVPIVNIIVWIVAAAKYSSKMKAAEALEKNNCN